MRHRPQQLEAPCLGLQRPAVGKSVGALQRKHFNMSTPNVWFVLVELCGWPVSSEWVKLIKCFMCSSNWFCAVLARVWSFVFVWIRVWGSCALVSESEKGKRSSLVGAGSFELWWFFSWLKACNNILFGVGFKCGIIRV